MDIKQGFSLSFQPVDGDASFYQLSMYTHMSIGGKVTTRDLLRGVMVELDDAWAQNIPADQFAVLAVEVASKMITVGYPADMTEGFREDIARAMEAIVKPLLGK